MKTRKFSLWLAFSTKEAWASEIQAKASRVTPERTQEPIKTFSTPEIRSSTGKTEISCLVTSSLSPPISFISTPSLPLKAATDIYFNWILCIVEESRKKVRLICLDFHVWHSGVTTPFENTEGCQSSIPSFKRTWTNIESTSNIISKRELK